MLERLGRFLPVRRRRLRQDIERAFERFFDDPGSLVASELALDVEDHDDHYVLKAEVPGLGEDDLEVHLEGNTLVIEGERKEEVKRRRVSEIYYGSLYRAVTLPEDAKLDEIETKLRRGVLEVTVPRERHEKRRIEIAKA
jgi:HSP20 family protein